VSNYPQYHVIEILTLQTVQLPNEVITSGTTALVLEQQNSVAGTWSAALFDNPNTGMARAQFQANFNLSDTPNIYFVGQPWPDLPSAQAAAQADYAALVARRNGTVTQAQLQTQITSSAFVSLITTVAGPG
jgi:hypothetical protein